MLIEDLVIQLSPIILFNGLNKALKDFYEQAKYIRGPQKIFTFSLRPLNSFVYQFRKTY
jgi:hypothetical protein